MVAPLGRRGPRRRSACSSSERGRSARAGTPGGETRRSSTRSARCSTGCRSASSSPRRGSPCSRSCRSATGSRRDLPLPGSRAARRAGAPADARRRRRLEPRPARRRLQRGSIDCRSSRAGSTLEQAGLVAAGDDEGHVDLLDDLRRSSSTRASSSATPTSRRGQVPAAADHPDPSRRRGSGRRRRRAAARRRHAEAFLALPPRPAPRGHGDPSGSWLDAWSADDANLRAAVRVVRSTPARRTLALRFVGASVALLAGGRPPASRAGCSPSPRPRDARVPRPTPARMWAVAAAGSIAYWQADLAARARWYEEQSSSPEARDDGADRRRALQPWPRGLRSIRRRDRGTPSRRSTRPLRVSTRSATSAASRGRTGRVGNRLLESGDPESAHRDLSGRRDRFERARRRAVHAHDGREPRLGVVPRWAT